ncbi:hypothetical protein SAY87_010999 [Trapa incisa]|uniref:Uncharacterized protein n=1 Tax=Trapa incisa TaxID=236973 RepID=A0AAN7GXB2_9MYRT|nr:hypothetical protein SAY87_010999 [Trapa incisa]
MGGSSRFHKKASSSAPSSFSFFSFFKTMSRRTARLARDDSWADDAMSPRKVWPSDYDKGRYVAEPGIDRLASAFIAKFHETRVSESEIQTIKV